MPELRTIFAVLGFLAISHVDGAPLAATSAVAAQPWSCICNGQPKRHLASTRFCEHQMGVPKGQTCTWLQWRMVYAPACRERGCYLPWRH